jgi:hypothetical protein
VTTDARITEVEAVRRERAAAKRMALAFEPTLRAAERGEPFGGLAPTPWWDCAALEERIAAMFPLPTMERPRVAVDPHDAGTWWSVRDGALCVKSRGVVTSHWSRVALGGFQPTPARVALWADLFANPTERVPADEADA